MKSLPAPSKLGIPDFIDEWVSAVSDPAADQKQILEGLVWLEAESKKRFEKGFSNLKEEQKCQICDDICFAPRAKPEFKAAVNSSPRCAT